MKNTSASFFLRRLRSLLVGTGLAMIAAITLRANTVVVQPTLLAQPPMFGLYAADNVRNQFGLIPGYVSGVTLYSTYVGQNPVQDSLGMATATFAMTIDNVLGEWDFDLGGTYEVKHFLFWNTQNDLTSHVKNFEIFVANDPSFVDAVSAGSFTSNPTSAEFPTPIETFDLTPRTGRYVRFRVLSNAGNLRTVFGEVAFGVSAPDTTPPTIVSITRQAPVAQVIGPASSTVTFRVTYSEAVANVTISDFTIEAIGGGDLVASVTGVSGSGDTRDVTVSILGGSGEFRLNAVNAP